MKKINQKYFIDDTKVVESIDSILSDDEEILWRAKPYKKSFIWSAVLKFLPIALIWAAIDITIICIFCFIIPEIDWFFYLILGIFFLIHLMPVWIYIYNIVSSFRRLKIEEYAFTSTRILIKKGFLAPNIVSIYYSSITSINLRVGVIEKLCKVGDIYIVAQNGKSVIEDVENPYYIYSELQRIANDIKSDIIYPNAYRPKENKGYKTSYKSEKDLLKNE